MLKRFEKLQYMVIGAILMAVGIGIGSIFTSPLVAQRSDKFDTLICRKLFVVNEDDEPIVSILSTPDADGIVIFDRMGEKAIDISNSLKGRGIKVMSPNTDEAAAFLAVSEDMNALGINDAMGKPAVAIATRAESNSRALTVFNDTGKTVLSIDNTIDSTVMFISDKNGKEAVAIGNSPKGNTVEFMSPHTGKKAAMLTVRDDINTLILTDEKGEIATVLHGKSGDTYLGVRNSLGQIYKYTGPVTTVTTQPITPKSE